MGKDGGRVEWEPVLVVWGTEGRREGGREGRREGGREGKRDEHCKPLQVEEGAKDATKDYSLGDKQPSGLGVYVHFSQFSKIIHKLFHQVHVPVHLSC